MNNSHKLLDVDQVYCGSAPDLIKRIQDETIACSVWSPPYFVGKEYESHLTFDGWKELLRETIAEHVRVLKSGGFLVINIADILVFPDPNIPRIQAPNVSKQRSPVSREMVLEAKAENPDFNKHQLAKLLGCSEQTIDRRLNGNNIRGGKYNTQTRVHLVGQMLNDYAYEAGLYLYDRRVWKKDPAWRNSQWHSNSYRSVDEFEYIYMFWKPGETKVDRARLTKSEWSDWGSRAVWEFRSVQANKEHEAQFPLELPTRVIKLLTDKQDVVLDCFMGSGTTAVACVQNGRHYIGIDLSQKYVDLSKQKIEAAKEGLGFLDPML